MSVRGKTAIVTGAAAGIGYGVARRLAAEGARVIGVDRHPDIGDIARTIPDATGVQLDLTDRVAADEFVAGYRDELDIVVNVAGITRDAFLHKMTDEQWDTVVSVDLTAVFTVTRAATRIMRARGNGRIINISSASWLGNLAQANYAAAKAGVVGLTLTAARELGRSGSTANVICPGFIDTAMTRAMPEELFAAQLEKIALGRAGRPEDVAGLVAFLAGGDGGYITGEVIDVGGGYRI